MIVVRILGGLGNQLDAYACAYTVAKHVEQPLMIDISDYTAGYFRPYLLDFLNIPNHAKIYYPCKMPGYMKINSTPSELARIFDCVVDTSEVSTVPTRDDLLKMVEKKRNIYLQGYGGIKYCTDEDKKSLRELFQLKKKSAVVESFCEEVSKEKSVSVHIRRTDFLQVGGSSDEWENYYKAAIKWFENQGEGFKFYFFSDDIEWVKQKFGYDENYEFVHLIGGVDADLEEMFCMAACKHHILTNQSTYGRWASFLSLDQSGINIINGKDSLVEVNNRVVINADDINNLISNDECGIKNIQSNVVGEKEVEYLFSLLNANRNHEVIQVIDKWCIAGKAICSVMEEKLLECKGIALIQQQNAEYSVDSIFRKLQQNQRDLFDFSFNYSIALKQSERHLESALYAGNVIRLSGNDEIFDFIQCNEKEKNIAKFIGNTRPKHYIFLNVHKWHNGHGYYDSLEIMLRNLGNEVTILEMIFEENNDFVLTKDEEILQKILSTGQVLDCVYNYGLSRYQIPVLQDRNMLRIVDGLIEKINSGKEVVLVTHWIEGLILHSGKWPLMMIDYISEWDVYKEYTDLYSEEDWDCIFEYTSVVLSHRSNFIGKDKLIIPQKGTLATKKNQICYEKSIVKDVGYFVRNDELIYGCIELIKVAEDIWTNRRV